MDLRPYIKNDRDLEDVKRLIEATHFVYQPFILSEKLEVGGGYEFTYNQPGAGMVYWPTALSEIKDIENSLVKKF